MVLRSVKDRGRSIVTSGRTNSAVVEKALKDLSYH